MLELTGEWLLPVRRCTPLTEAAVVQFLPANAQPVVQVDERVSVDQPIARLIERRLQVVDLAGALDLPGRDLTPALLKRRGDAVQVGDMLAARKGGLPFVYRPYRAPVAGQIVAVTHGWVVIETAVEATDICALVPGRVADIVPYPSPGGTCQSVTIDYSGAVLDGVCGRGGVACGVLTCFGPEDGAEAAPETITAILSGGILAVRGCVTREMAGHAATVGVTGIVAGSLAVDLARGGGAPLPVLATEGFGRQSMAADRWHLLGQLAGRPAVLAAPDDLAWPPQPPALFVPEADAPPPVRNRAAAGLDLSRPVRAGDRVRAVRAPFAGRAGEVIAPHAGGRATIAGRLPGVEVRFDSNGPVNSPSDRRREQWVPWLNLERIG